jgi:hypothetical protein
MNRERQINPREGEGVPWAQCAGWGAAILIAAAACGGATRSGADDPDASTAAQKDGGTQSDSGVTGMGKRNLECSDVVAGGACEQGDTCDPQCGSPCQFCGFLSCNDGVWTEGEDFPLPPTDPMCMDGGADAEAGVH